MSLLKVRRIDERRRAAPWMSFLRSRSDIILSLRTNRQIPQPDGLQAGAANPPDPEGIPWALTQLADISFSTSAHSHWGHLGGGSSADKVNSSKQLQQALHWYSKIGMGWTGSFEKIFTYNNVKPGQVKAKKIWIHFKFRYFLNKYDDHCYRCPCLQIQRKSFSLF